MFNIIQKGLNYRSLKLIWLIGLTGFIYFQAGYSNVAAQTTPSPALDSNSPDPLLPNLIERPLTSFEKYRIAKEITKINEAAKIELEKGNEEAAFSLWYRELRLQRAVDRLLEIKSLGKVGDIAWQENRGSDVRVIANRLIEIQREETTSKAIDLELLNSLGTAFQQVRYLDKAIDIYQQILLNARQEDSLKDQVNTLEILGELYLARFDYTQAATTYEDLLTLVSTESPVIDNNEAREATYLDNLIAIYDRTAQLDKAIAIKKQMTTKYLAAQKIAPLANLNMAIAQDYENLKQPKTAIQYYQQALTIASNSLQLAIASEALTKIAELYQQSDRLDNALQSYQKLIPIQQQSYDYYGLMNTYDRIGKIHLKLNNHPEALLAFERGLKLAQSLKYRVDYFRDRINDQLSIIND